MTKYRIIEIQECDKTYYLLQVRKLFWWSTECDGGYDQLGSYEYPRKFQTKQEAKAFYTKWYTKPKRSVVEVGW